MALNALREGKRSMSDSAKASLVAALGEGSPGAALWIALRLRDEAGVDDALRCGADHSLRWPGSELTPLQAAAGMGLLGVCKLLLDAGADHGAPGAAGRHPLAAAAAAGRVECVCELLARGADARHVDSKGLTALALCGGSDPVVAKMLMEASGMDKDAPGPDGSTAMMRAAKGGNVKGIRALLGLGADPLARRSDGHTALSLACHAGSSRSVRALLDFSELDIRVVSDGRDGHGGKTPLMFAVEAGNEASVRILCAAGVDLDLVDDWGRSALMMASRRAIVPMVEALISKGADASFLDRGGENAMSMALKAPSAEGAAGCIRALAKAGIDIEKPPGHPGSAHYRAVTYLMIAAERGQAGRLQDLLGLGALLDARDLKGEAALTHAARAGSRECVMALLRAGADMEAKSLLGKTASDAALSRGYSMLEGEMQAYALQVKESGELEAMLAQSSASSAKPRL